MKIQRRMRSVASRAIGDARQIDRVRRKNPGLRAQVLRRHGPCGTKDFGRRPTLLSREILHSRG